MRTKASIKNHPIHPMIVSLPIGLWIFSFVGDILYLTGAGGEWRVISLYTMMGGIAGALLAAVPGFIDYFTLTGEQTRKIATFHMLLNLGAVVLYSFNAYYRVNNELQVQGMPFVLSLATIVLLGISGWLGGELVYVHKVAVSEGK